MPSLSFPPWMANDEDNEIPATVVGPLMVELMYDHKPTVDMDRLTERVITHCGRIGPSSRHKTGDDSAHYFMSDAIVEFTEGKLPTQLCLFTGERIPSKEKLAPSLQQTWDWPEAAQVTGACTYHLIATDLMASALDWKVRNRQFRGFLRALQEVVPCQAMHWMNTQMVVNPRRFLFQQDEAPAQQLYGSINVRFFNIEGTQGERLMDTLGLGVLGLPDLQCHYRELHPPEVARVLYNTAFYLFENGDVIKDGQTTTGLLDHDWWECQHEMALVGPERIVLDLNPGEPYAAGGRKHQ